MDSRPFFRCPHCQLVQFATRLGQCRRCERILNVLVYLRRKKMLQDRKGSLPRTVRDIGSRLREIRRRFGMTQHTLERKSGITRSYLSRMESGQMTPTIAILEKFSDAFRVSLGDMLRPANFFSEVLNELPGLTGSQRENLIYVMRMLATKHREGQALAERFLGTTKKVA